MKVVRSVACAAIAMSLLTATLVAHEVTYKGTVVSTEKATVKVTVVNEKTKKPETITFKVDKETKILRGDKLMAFEQAKVQKGEKVAVTVNHDLDEDLALVIRLDAAK